MIFIYNVITRLTVFCLLFISLFLINNSFITVNAEPSIPPAGKKWVKVWSDEFDGDTLDTTRWGFMSEDSGGSETYGEQGVTWRYENDNVSVADGNLILTNTFQPADEDSGTSAELQVAMVSTQDIYEKTYGYFEAKIKIAPTSDGVHTAFSLQSLGKELTSGNNGVDGATDGAEIDILESVRTGNSFDQAIYWDDWNQMTQSRSRSVADFLIHDGEYHIFALEWNEGEYKFYVDGKLTWHYSSNDEEDGVSQSDEFITLSTGLSWGDGNPVTGIFPNKASVDWIRVWELRDNPSINLSPTEVQSFITIPNPKFDEIYYVMDNVDDHTFVSGNCYAVSSSLISGDLNNPFRLGHFVRSDGTTDSLQSTADHYCNLLGYDYALDHGDSWDLHTTPLDDLDIDSGNVHPINECIANPDKVSVTIGSHINSAGGYDITLNYGKTVESGLKQRYFNDITCIEERDEVIIPLLNYVKLIQNVHVKNIRKSLIGIDSESQNITGNRRSRFSSFDEILDNPRMLLGYHRTSDHVHKDLDATLTAVCKTADLDTYAGYQSLRTNVIGVSSGNSCNMDDTDNDIIISLTSADAVRVVSKRSGMWDRFEIHGVSCTLSQRDPVMSNRIEVNNDVLEIVFDNLIHSTGNDAAKSLLAINVSQTGTASINISSYNGVDSVVEDVVSVSNFDILNTYFNSTNLRSVARSVRLSDDSGNAYIIAVANNTSVPSKVIYMVLSTPQSAEDSAGITLFPAFEDAYRHILSL